MSDETPETISGVLSYYSENVVPIVAAAIVVDESFPKETLNEFRNALTHLGRANRLSNDDGSDQYDVAASYRHLRRIALDSAKTCIANTAQRCESAILAIEKERIVANSSHKRISELRRKRQELAVFEGKNEPNEELLSQYYTLMDEYDEFYQSIDDEYFSQQAVERQAQHDKMKARERWRERGYGVGIGLLTSGVIAFVVTL